MTFYAGLLNTSRPSATERTEPHGLPFTEGSTGGLPTTHIARINMDIKTDIWKGQREGWKARSVISMGAALDHSDNECERCLTISTYKGSRGGIYSHAGVALHRDGIMTTDLFGDFRKTLIPTDGTKCTEKNVKAMHERALLQADAVLAEAVAFYVVKDAKAAQDKARRDERAANLPDHRSAHATA